MSQTTPPPANTQLSLPPLIPKFKISNSTEVPTESTPSNSSPVKTGGARKRKLVFNSREEELQTKLRRARAEMGNLRMRNRDLENERNRALTETASVRAWHSRCLDKWRESTAKHQAMAQELFAERAAKFAALSQYHAIMNQATKTGRVPFEHPGGIVPPTNSDQQKSNSSCSKPVENKAGGLYDSAPSPVLDDNGVMDE